MKHLEKLGLIIAPLAIYSCGEKQSEATKPNIVYIMTDDHSYQTISAYGSELSKLAPTPNLDRLANEGILFQQAFVENSLSTPSRACLMTGLYSHQNGQRQLCEGIDSTKVFFSELLQQAGYQTGVVGKWHMRCQPKGFDYYHILNDQGQYYNPEFKGTDTDGKFVREEGYATHLTTDHAIEFIEKREENKPFCLLVHHKAPHRNWMPEQKYLNLYERVEFPLPESFWDDYENKCGASNQQKMSISKNLELIQDLKLDTLKNKANGPLEMLSYRFLLNELERMSPEERAAWDKAYSGRNKEFVESNLQGKDLIVWKYQNYIRDYLRCIKSVDDEVGRLISYLEKEGLLDNTIIVYTSDQGFYMGEHGWFDKRFMYEESFRTPLIMRYPKAIKAGTKSSALVQNIDYAPTFLSLAGIDKPEEMSGSSLEPLFQGEKPENWRTSLYYHYYDYPAIHNVRRHDGVRTDRYKLIHFYGKGGMAGATNPYQMDEKSDEYRILALMNKYGLIPDDPDINCNELYDLQDDPNEMNNLYGKPGYENVTAELEAKLDKYRKDLKVPENEY